MNKIHDKMLEQLRAACEEVPQKALTNFIRDLRRRAGVGDVGVRLAVLLETAVGESITKGKVRTAIVKVSTNDGSEKDILLHVGSVVNLHPCCDIWMKGATSAEVMEIIIYEVGIEIKVCPIVGNTRARGVYISPRHILVKATGE